MSLSLSAAWREKEPLRTSPSRSLQPRFACCCSPNSVSGRDDCSRRAGFCDELNSIKLRQWLQVAMMDQAQVRIAELETLVASLQSQLLEARKQAPNGPQLCTDGSVADASADAVEAPVELAAAAEGTCWPCEAVVTRHIALKLMYLGARYHGFASQAAGQPTVEAELIAALRTTRLVFGDWSNVQYSRCGRTDKGVSAMGQVVALYLRSALKIENAGQGDFAREADKDILPEGASCTSKSEEMLRQVEDEDKVAPNTCREQELAAEQGRELDMHNGRQVGVHSKPPDRVQAAVASRAQEAVLAAAACHGEIDYVKVLNAALPQDIRVLGWCPVPQYFSARFSCLSREYSYFFHGASLDIASMRTAAAYFVGEHDFRNFCKMDALNVHNYRREVLKCEIVPALGGLTGAGEPGVWELKVTGRAFLWHQVRYMAAVLFLVGTGRESPTARALPFFLIVMDLVDLEKYPRKPQYSLAPEQPLMLAACRYQGVLFKVSAGALRALQQDIQANLHSCRIMACMLQNIKLGIGQSAVEAVPEDHLSTNGRSSKERGGYMLLRDRITEPTYEARIECQKAKESRKALSTLCGRSQAKRALRKKVEGSPRKSLRQALALTFMCTAADEWCLVMSINTSWHRPPSAGACPLHSLEKDGALCNMYQMEAEPTTAID
eukprot:SM000107S14097  [mRNA]  locus=s107:365180:370412:- [translate_table: standard]